MMEEVDRIILHYLRQIGCDLDEGDVKSLQQFNTDMVVEATVTCLRNIVPSFEMSERLPPGMTARFRVGSSLAQACHDLGYQGEVGYQTFLYWDEVDIRRVLMFLIEKLPKESEKASEEPLSSAALLNARIASEIRKRLGVPWLPKQFQFKAVKLTEVRKKTVALRVFRLQDFSKCHPFRTCSLLFPKDLTVATNEMTRYYSEHLPVVADQPLTRRGVCSSVIESNTASLSAANAWESEWNQTGLTSRLSEREYRVQKRRQIRQRLHLHFREESQKIASGSSAVSHGQSLKQVLSLIDDGTVGDTQQMSVDSRFALTKRLVYEKADESERFLVASPTSTQPAESEEESRKRQLEEVMDLKARIESLEGQLDELKLDGKKLEGSIQQIGERLSSKRAKNEEFLGIYEIKKKTFDLLPDADANLEKLQAVVDATVQRLVGLAGQWEMHRAPLIDQYRTLRELNASRVSETQRKLEEIRTLREKMKEIAEEARTKGEMHSHLTAEHEKMAREVNRSAYTRRILEIVANIKKQKQEIDKVLVDTKEVQKEINQLSGKLDRTFTVTDELVFKDAKKDESVRKAYKYLAALHENCSLLVKTVEETGAIMREIRDLEDQIENENQKKVLGNLERITADYRQMKQENVSLASKLKERTEDDQ